MNNSFFNWPKFNWKGIPRIAKWATEGNQDNWTWYDKQGNTVDPDPYTQNEIYDATGSRWVFARGDWTKDDPTAWRAYNHPATAAVMYALANGGPIGKEAFTYTPFQSGLMVEPYVAKALGPAGRWVVENVPAGVLGYAASETAGKIAGAKGDNWEQMQERYGFMTPNGEYVKEYGPDGTPQLIKKGTWEWVLARWGDNPPMDVVDEFMRTYGATSPDVLDVTPLEAQWLDAPDQFAARIMLNLQSSMGTPNSFDDYFGKRQYSITLPGEGDRWKYVIQKDQEGNWVKVYRRVWGAKKEKELALKKKGKWDKKK